MNKALVLLALLAVGFAATTERVVENNAADALVDEVSRMQGDIREEQQRHDQLWQAQSDECGAEFEFRNKEVNDAAAAFDAAQASAGRCQNAWTASQADLEKARNYVSTINGILSNLAAQRSAENASFNVLVNDELKPAIEAVEGAYPILRDFASQNQSFVQFSDNLNKIFVHMVKAKKVNQFSTIVAVLLQAPDFQHGISGDVIAQLEQLFNELSDDLNKALDKAIETENEQVRVYNQTVSEYAAVLENLGRTIAQLEAYVEELSACVTHEGAIASEADAKRRRNQEALNYAADMCHAFDTEYHNSTHARDEELALLEKLKSFVRQQEDIFGNYGNDGVNAFDEYKKSFQLQRTGQRHDFMQLKLKEFKSKSHSKSIPTPKCESCRKSFIQKKLGF